MRTHPFLFIFTIVSLMSILLTCDTFTSHAILEETGFRNYPSSTVVVVVVVIITIIIVLTVVLNDI